MIPTSLIIPATTGYGAAASALSSVVETPNRSANVTNALSRESAKVSNFSHALLFVLGFLEPRDIKRVACTAKVCQQLVLDPLTWKEITQREFPGMLAVGAHAAHESWRTTYGRLEQKRLERRRSINDHLRNRTLGQTHARVLGFIPIGGAVQNVLTGQEKYFGKFKLPVQKADSRFRL